jgi:hypothetical protein
MKRFLLILVTLVSILDFSFATTVQGTIKKIDNMIVGAYVKPIGGNIVGTIANFNITFSLNALGQTNPATAPVPTSVVTSYGAASPVAVEIISGRYVYAYVVTGNPVTVNWTNGNEYLVLQVTFPANSQTIGQVMKLHSYDPNGGNSGQALFDIGVNGIFYVDYAAEFYGTNVSNNGPNAPSSVDAPAPLPVTLVSFKAEKFQDRSTHLTWSTASEINSSHFQVERSLDNKTWTSIGTVNAAGNSQLIENYEFTDLNVYNGRDSRLVAFYRLRIVDFDNQQKLSPVQSVVFGTGTSGREISVYPNPASEGVQVEWDANRIDQPTALEFFDVSGKLIYTRQVAENSNQEYIDFGQTTIQPGLYLLRILNGEEALDYKQIVVGQR